MQVAVAVVLEIVEAQVATEAVLMVAQMQLAALAQLILAVVVAVVELLPIELVGQQGQV
jgi:hypothetical protein